MVFEGGASRTTGGGARRWLAVAAGLYLAGIWLDAAGVPVERVLPRPVAYFLQVAKLFPNAVPYATEYRAEAYFCDDHAWRELDVRPFFPLHASDKESRFERAMFFFHRTHAVMRALDDYLVSANNAAGPAVGGVLLLSVRIPVPPPGTAFERYQRRPLPDYPPASRKYWYRTSTDQIDDRCDRALEEHGPASP